MTWCSRIKTFPPWDSTQSRRHKLYQKDPTCHQNDTFSRVFRVQGGSSLYTSSPQYVSKKHNQWYNF